VVYALLGETLLERTTQDWLDLLWSLDIPAALVRTLHELLDNPHLNEVGFFETVDTPNGPGAFSGHAGLVLANSRPYRRSRP
jgi:crotonobetainyl-CoA:carnitine CoA-transferase CaiB-like acyl-CoA transferase